MLGLAVACAETKKVEENNAEETATVEAVEVVEEAVEAPAEVVVETPAEAVEEVAETPELPSIKTDIQVDTKVESNDRKPITEAPKTRVETKKPAKNVPLKPAGTIKE